MKYFKQVSVQKQVMINRGFIEEADCPALHYQRMTKPLIEKRRRARINGCLGKLKEMVIDSGRHNIQVQSKTVFIRLYLFDS